MIVFLVSIVVALAAACLGVAVYAVKAKNDADVAARDERSYLLNAILARHGTEFRAMTVPADGPATPKANEFWDRVEGFEQPVGL